MNNRDGFSLLEVLIALVMLGLLLVLVRRGVDVGRDTAARTSLAIAARGDLEPVDRALRQLIEQADPGAAGWSPTFAGDAHTVSLVTDLPTVSARQAVVTLRVDGNRRLVLRWRARVGDPAAEQTTVLADHVLRLEVSYWRDSGPGGGWTTEALPSRPCAG